jgi:hypothetical protein
MESKYVFLIAAIIVYTIIVYLFSRLGKRREIGPRRLFWLSFFLTPILGIAFYASSHHRKIIPYTEPSFKCDRCGYIFSELHAECPFCLKEGYHEKLNPVTKIMT